MIQINMAFDNVADMHTALAAILAGAAVTVSSGSTATPVLTAPETKPDPKPAKAAKKAAAATAETPETPSTGQTAGFAGDAGTAGSSEPATRASVAPRCSAYAQKAGPEALKQLFIEMGAANGKFSEVPEDKIGMLDARLAEMGM